MPYLTTPERIGIEMGRSQGLTQGLTQGRSEGLLIGIEVALRLRFADRGVVLLPEIRQLVSLEKLEAILHAIETAATPEELRRLWAE